MIEKTEPLITRECSLINHQWFTSDDAAFIGIFQQDHSRTIFIESGHDDTHTITKYSTLSPKEKYPSSLLERWEISLPPPSRETAAEIRSLKKASRNFSESRVTHEEMALFKSRIDEATRQQWVSIDAHDKIIEEAWREIGKSIKLSHSTGCCIS